MAQDFLLNNKKKLCKFFGPNDAYLQLQVIFFNYL